MLKNFLNSTKTTLKKSRIRIFRPQKWSKMTPQNRQRTTFLTENLGSQDHLPTFQAENTPTSGTFKTENNPRTLLKQL